MNTAFSRNSFAYTKLARGTNKYALAIILNISINIVSFAGDKIPSSHIILVKALQICGAEDTYSVEANRFTDRQLEWIRTVLHFTLNVEPLTFPGGAGGFSFATDTGRKVSQREMTRLLADRDFSRWMGNDIVKKIRAVSAALLELDKYRASLTRSKNSSEYLNDAKPVVQKYWEAYIDLDRKLTSKFKITATDTGTDCN